MPNVDPKIVNHFSPKTEKRIGTRSPFRISRNFCSRVSISILALIETARVYLQPRVTKVYLLVCFSRAFFSRYNSVHGFIILVGARPILKANCILGALPDEKFDIKADYVIYIDSNFSLRIAEINSEPGRKGERKLVSEVRIEVVANLFLKQYLI